MTPTLTLPRPDDWHVHLRDDAMLAAVIADTADNFARAIVMPNLNPPVTTGELARAYRERILSVTPEGSDFEPLMTCYLTDNTDGEGLVAAHAAGAVTAAKLYPAGATTNSDAGVTDIARLDGVFAAMAAGDMPLLIHGEVVDPQVDVFDREAAFIREVLDPVRRRHPRLRIVLEHITTSEAVAYVSAADPALLCATITAHHLCINRNAMFSGGLRPHYYCLPVAKREQHREALVAAACSGDEHFFLGTDSAPHARDDKESACGCAGIYSSAVAMETYLEVFAAADALDALRAFACENGPRFYHLPVNTDAVVYERCASPPVPPRHDGIEVFEPPMPLYWRRRDP